MKNVKTLYMAPLLLLLTSCYHYNEHIIIAARDLPVGTVLQLSDLRRDHAWTIDEEGALMRFPYQIVGHKTLHPLAKGATLHRIDIEGTTGSGEPIPYWCP